jgi:hypothetical protein
MIAAHAQSCNLGASDMSDDSSPTPLDSSKRRRIAIDPTINVGNMVAILAGLAAVAGAYADAKSDVRAQDVRLTAEQRANQERYERLLDDIRAIRSDGRETMAEVRRVADELRRGSSK